jgi:hypothetical protein
MLAGFKRIRPSAQAWRRVGMAGFVAGVAALAFFCGRHGAPRAVAQAPLTFGPNERPGDDYNRRVVAFIHGNIPITREELGEYLIARVGAQRVEYLVNRRIIEMACAQGRITVSDAEVDEQLRADLKLFEGNITEKDFVEKVLKRYNKTLYEWREDVIRPRIALSKFCRGKVQVTDEDIQNAFEAHYGEQVKCRMIVFPQEMRRDIEAIWVKLKASEEEFDKLASSQFIPQLAAHKGAIPPIHKHFSDKQIEKEAFALRNPGDVTPCLEMPDKTIVVLKLVERTPANTTVRLSEVRPALHKEVEEFKLNQMIPLVFKGMREQARPNILLKGEAAAPQQVAQPHLQGMPVGPGVMNVH